MAGNRAAERAAAFSKGDIYYFTGKPCKLGHVAKRRVLNGCCLECEKIKNKRAVETGYSAAYAEKNRETIRKTALRWQKNNKGKVNANTAMRHTVKMSRTPGWLTKEDKSYIKCLYQLAAMRNRCDDKKWHVDHIVPLQGESVSGLHVPWNLRVIPAVENIRKGNKFNE